MNNLMLIILSIVVHIFVCFYIHFLENKIEEKTDKKISEEALLNELLTKRSKENMDVLAELIKNEKCPKCRLDREFDSWKCDRCNADIKQIYNNNLKLNFICSGIILIVLDIMLLLCLPIGEYWPIFLVFPIYIFRISYFFVLVGGKSYFSYRIKKNRIIKDKLKKEEIGLTKIKKENNIKNKN